MKKWLILSVLINSTLSFSADNYCVGIRGNGELAPAHWGAMSRIVENKGLPHTVAGGSSAAMTMFLLDAMSRNHLYSEDNKNLEQALLLKSLVPHINYLLREDVKVPQLMRLISNITGLKDGGFVSKLKKAVKIARDLDTFMEVLGEYGRLLNPEIVIGLKENFSFYKGQVAEGIKVFGAFDAKNDMAILYRKGLIDFKQIALILGRVADFYAGYGEVEVNEKLNTFMQSCADPAKDKLWRELIVSNPECQSLFENSLSAYYSNKIKKVTNYRFQRKVPYRRNAKQPREFPDKMIFEKIGSGLNTFPTTSLLVGDAVNRYEDFARAYEKSNASDYSQFTIDFDSEIKYGYWGRESELTQIKKNLINLYPSDFKSSKFTPLESGIWFEALATSPAEPGLSSVLRIPDGKKITPSKVINKKYFYKSFFGLLPSLKAIPWFHKSNPHKGVIPFRENILSAGGWNDLHPTLVLKANGCEDITYLTRQGGESVFGQQIFIRITGYTETIDFWKDIKDHNRDGWTNLTPEVKASPWNNLYNLMNPESSFNKSIKASTAVYCTDWDQYYVLKGEVEKVLEDAYNAPIFVNNEDYRNSYDFGGDPAGKSPDGFPGCILKNF